MDKETAFQPPCGPFQRLEWNAEEGRWRVRDMTEAEREAAFPAPPPPPDERPPETIIAAEIAALIDATARQRGYASMVSAATYRSSRNPLWAAEAAALLDWRDAVWETAYAALADWQAGGETPSLEALLATLPAIAWPEPAAQG
jgi:hypothetical protein